MLDLKDKKVEYIELIYDLIFVYLIGRNNSLLDRIEAGFVSFSTFGTYLLTSLIIIQIWYYTTIFINRLGKNGLAENIMMFLNMFLLYIMGATTVFGWDINYGAYMGAWTIILLNFAVQYLIKLRSITAGHLRTYIIQMTTVLLIQAAYIGASILIYQKTGTAIGQWSVFIGFAAVPLLKKVPVNFEHLTERAMLYVVFTFGEMIITVADYFTEGFTFTTLYFAAASFLNVAGLFFCYGYVYDKLLDRNRRDTGALYLILHVFIIMSLSCVTTALEFMHNDEAEDAPSALFLAGSLLVFFICLALTEHWSVRKIEKAGRFRIITIAEFLVYAAAIYLLRYNGYAVSIITTVFIFIQLLTLVLSAKYTSARSLRPDGPEEHAQEEK